MQGGQLVARLARVEQPKGVSYKLKAYKVLLGAFWLNEIINNPLLEVDRNFPKLRKFINDEKKFNELRMFINAEIEKGKKMR